MGVAVQKTVYVETTIPSFYYETRSEPEAVARRQWTREWWDAAAERFRLVTSEAVLDELERGEFEKKNDCLALISSLPVLEVEDAVAEIVESYVNHKVMPKDPVGDALHLALASYYRCDFLLTWNCRHLANASKFDHIRRINAMMGLYVPVLTTPLELLASEDVS
jgi:predicted nucleic acid-binding protein